MIYPRELKYQCPISYRATTLEAPMLYMLFSGPAVHNEIDLSKMNEWMWEWQTTVVFWTVRNTWALLRMMYSQKACRYNLLLLYIFKSIDSNIFIAAACLYIGQKIYPSRKRSLRLETLEHTESHLSDKVLLFPLAQKGETPNRTANCQLSATTMKSPYLNLNRL